MFAVPARLFVGVCLAVPALAQAPDKIDFARDVQPIFRQNCTGCHGATQQVAGLRLDRRSSLLKPGLRRVVPGNSGNSFLYHRIAGSAFGLQMPPGGALRPDQVRIVQAWIDQGAEWPDTLANEADRPPLNPKAVALVEALRNGARQQFLKAVAESPALLNARGPEGSTPFMYAALYCDAPALAQLLKKGADPNARNDVQATALMWAAGNLEKVRVLVAHGADVNARSDDVRTPLTIAAGHPGGAPVVKFLLDHGANPNPTRNPDIESSPLIQAAEAGDAESMRLLIAHGADVKASAAGGIVNALTVECAACASLLFPADLGKEAATFVLLQVANFADAKTVRYLVDRGADVNALDPLGRSALMYVAVSDLAPVDVAKVLLEHGADVNARCAHAKSGDTGMSVLDIARMQGETPLVELLRKAGATSAVERGAAPQPRPAGSLAGAIERAIPKMQIADASFAAKSGCVSCHNNNFESMALGLAQNRGFAVDRAMVARQVKTNADYLEHERDSMHQGSFQAQAGAAPFADVFGPSNIAYVLLGLEAQQYRPDLSTDAAAMYLKSRQSPDGRWAYSVADTRQPICADYFGQTAVALRALQLYAPRVDRAAYENAIRLAGSWLARAEPKGNEDRYWRLLGLAWYARDKDATQKALRDVLGLQHPDGGWSDLPTTASTAYATGRALVALAAAGVPIGDAAYQRGARFLLNTQLEDGTWYVRTRALGFQPYFETGFPHGVDQFLSAAGTSWAAMALTLASPPASGDAQRSSASPLR